MANDPITVRFRTTGSIWFYFCVRNRKNQTRPLRLSAYHCRNFKSAALDFLHVPACSQDFGPVLWLAEESTAWKTAGLID
jgi:hypothetical protein